MGIFGTIFGQSGLNFRTVWAEFSGLFLDSSDRIFETVFGQSGTDFLIVCVLFFFFFNVLLQNFE